MTDTVPVVLVGERARDPVRNYNRSFRGVCEQQLQPASLTHPKAPIALLADTARSPVSWGPSQMGGSCYSMEMGHDVT
eukprot:5369437-Prymnesium_polylepis.1